MWRLSTSLARLAFDSSALIDTQTSVGSQHKLNWLLIISHTTAHKSQVKSRHFIAFTMADSQADSACQHTTTWAYQTAPTDLPSPLTLMTALQVYSSVRKRARP